MATIESAFKGGWLILALLSYLKKK